MEGTLNEPDAAPAYFDKLSCVDAGMRYDDGGVVAKEIDSEHETPKKQDAQNELDAGLANFDKPKPSCFEAGVSYGDRAASKKEDIEFGEGRGIVDTLPDMTDKPKPSCVEAGVSYDDRIARKVEEGEGPCAFIAMLESEALAKCMA